MSFFLFKLSLLLPWIFYWWRHEHKLTDIVIFIYEQLKYKWGIRSVSNTNKSTYKKLHFPASNTNSSHGEDGSWNLCVCSASNQLLSKRSLESGCHYHTHSSHTSASHPWGNSAACKANEAFATCQKLSLTNNQNKSFFQVNHFWTWHFN